MEAELRDMAILATIILLWLLTLQVMRLTSRQRPTERRR